MSDPKPFVIEVTDTRVTQYVIHALDPGEAIRDTWKRGIEIHCAGDVRATAAPISEVSYDQALNGGTRFEVVTSTESVKVPNVSN